MLKFSFHDSERSPKCSPYKCEDGVVLQNNCSAGQHPADDERQNEYDSVKDDSNLLDFSVSQTR